MYSLRELSDYDRDTLLIPARFWLRNLPNRQAHELIRAISAAFDAYKVSVTDSRGRVRIENRRNLLSPSTQKRTRLVAANSLLPQQCAGPTVSNIIDLAFKLWLDGFPPLRTVIAEFGLLRTLAITGMVARKEADIESLMRLNNLLGEQLADSAIEAMRMVDEHQTSERSRKTVSAERTRKLQEISATKRREAKIWATEGMRRTAVEYWKLHPALSVDEVAEYVSVSVFKRKYTTTTVKRRIKGTKRLALEALSTPVPPR